MEISGKHIIKEADPRTHVVPSKSHWLELYDDNDVVFGIDRLAENLRSQDLSNIETLSIRSRSPLDELNFPLLFPNVSFIFLEDFGYRSLDKFRNMACLKHLRLELPCSRKLSIENLDSFQLKSLYIKICNPEYISNLVSCRSLEKLQVDNWPESDFRSMASMLLRDLTSVRSKASSLSGLNCSRLENLFVSLCPNLSDLGELRVFDLRIKKCHELSESCVAVASGLRKLTFTGQRNFRSFEFLRTLPELEELTLGGTPSTLVKDFSPIWEHKKLRRIFLSPPLSADVARKLAEKNRREPSHRIESSSM